MIRFPSDVSVTRWRLSGSRSGICRPSRWGQRTNGPLSILTESVAGLYSPSGEILVGFSGEFGATQTVPCCGGSEWRDDARSPIKNVLTPDFKILFMRTLPATSLTDPCVTTRDVLERAFSVAKKNPETSEPKHNALRGHSVLVWGQGLQPLSPRPFLRQRRCSSAALRIGFS